MFTEMIWLVRGKIVEIIDERRNSANAGLFRTITIEKGVGHPCSNSKTLAAPSLPWDIFRKWSLMDIPGRYLSPVFTVLQQEVGT